MTGRFSLPAALGLVAAVVALTAAGSAPAGPTASPPDPGLEVFRAWLDREHAGYGCDEGPARFRNGTVDQAYPGQRFYYVLTYTRGIPPPYKNSISLVAAIDDSGRVIPFRAGTPFSYRRGLKRAVSSKDAKLAAAAVLTLASCDPGGRRWAFRPERFKAKRESKGWKCTFQHDKFFASWVRFDRDGDLLEIGGSAPPVP